MAAICQGIMLTWIADGGYTLQWLLEESCLLIQEEEEKDEDMAGILGN